MYFHNRHLYKISKHTNVSIYVKQDKTYALFVFLSDVLIIYFEFLFSSEKNTFEKSMKMIICTLKAELSQIM